MFVLGNACQFYWNKKLQNQIWMKPAEGRERFHNKLIKDTSNNTTIVSRRDEIRRWSNLGDWRNTRSSI